MGRDRRDLASVERDARFQPCLPEQFCSSPGLFPSQGWIEFQTREMRMDTIHTIPMMAMNDPPILASDFTGT